MTDAEVTHRVEQALLGAMMARPRSAAQLRIGPEHFADQRHQAIAAALTGGAGTERGLFGRIIGFFTRRSRTAREAAAYMETLPDLCPEPAHIGTYFQMLSADRDQRVAEAQARVQAQGNQVLDVAAERLGEMRGRPDPSTGLPRGTARLARALRDLTGQRAPSPAPVQARAQAPGPDQARQAQGPARAPGQAPAETQGAARPQGQVPPQGNGRPMQAGQERPGQQAADGTRTSARASAGGGSAAQQRAADGPVFGAARFARPEDLQDAILAALMRHPEEADEVTGWLTPQAFTGQRRELYTMIRQYDQAGRDIDPVTLAWGAAQPSQNGQQTRLRPEFVLGLARMATAPGTASVVGRALLAEQVVTRELGPDWHLTQRPGAAPAPQHATGTPQPDQARNQRQEQDQQQNPLERSGQPGQQNQQRAPQNQPGQQEQHAPQNQDGPRNGRTPQNGAVGPDENASARNQGQPRPRRSGPYRQARPGAGTRPPARAAAGNAPVQVVPGNLIEQPPPAPGQGGPSQNR